MQNRGIMASIVENTIRKGKMEVGKEIGTKLFYKIGKVVTTSFGRIPQ